MFAKTKKISLSDRFGTIKPQVTLQQKVNMNSELVKKLQQKISNVVQKRQGCSLPESVAEKIGNDETECEDLNRRRDGTFNTDSFKFKNMKVQVTVNAKRNRSLTSVATDSCSKTPEKVGTSIGNHHGDERGLGKENNLKVSDHRKSNEQYNNQTHNINNCVKDTNKLHAFTKSSYSCQNQGIEFARDRFQGGINISPEKRKQISQSVPPFVKNSHSSTYDMRKPSPNLRNQEAFSPADRYMNRVDNDRGHYNCQEGNRITIALRDSPLYGTDTVPVNVHSEIEPCSSSLAKSGNPTVNVSDCTISVNRSPLKGNYSKTNEYNRCDNIPSLLNPTSPNYGLPLNQKREYNKRNTSPKYVPPLNQNRELSNRNDFQGQQIGALTSQPTRNRDGSFQNQQVYPPFNHQVLPKTTFDNHKDWRSRVSPQERHRIHQNIQSMPCNIDSNGSDMPMQNQNGFGSQPLQTNALHDASSDHNIDNHMGQLGQSYYEQSLKRNSPFETPGRVMIPAKKRMINEYLGQKSNDERNVDEMATHDVARMTSSSSAKNALFNTGRQNYSYEATLNTHNKIKKDFQQECIDVNDGFSAQNRPLFVYNGHSVQEIFNEGFVPTHLERETLYHENKISVSPCKDYMFDKEKHTALLDPKTNAPSGFYRELSKENHSPEKHQKFEGINDVKTQQFPQKKLFNTSTVKDQLVDTLLMQCQGLVEKENDRKALETIFDIIKKETNTLSSGTKVNRVGNSSVNSGYKHENGCTEKDTSIEGNCSKDRDVTKELKSKIQFDCSLKGNQNQDKVLEMTSDTESKFSPTLSSPDYYAKPNSSMKFEGRTLLKGGVVPRHIPKNLLDKFLKTPPTDPRCCRQQRNRVMELPLPLFFIDFVETVKKKKSAKQLSVEPEKSNHSGQVMKRELDSNKNVHSTVPSGSVDKCNADNNNTRDNFEIVDMDIVCETKNVEKMSSGELQEMCSKKDDVDTSMVDSIDLVLQAAKIIPKPANQNNECLQNTSTKPCDPRLKNNNTDTVKTDDLKFLRYPCFNSNYENGKQLQASEDPEARPVNLGCTATTDLKWKESTKSHGNVEKRSHSRSRSPDRNWRVNRSYSRDRSKSNSYDSPRYRSVKGSQKRNDTRRRKSEEVEPYRKIKAGSPKHFRRDYSRETSPHRIGRIANSSQFDRTSHCDKEWSRREIFVVETKSRSDFDIKEHFNVGKNSQSQPNNVSPDTYKFIERRSSARNFKHSDSHEQFPH